jgi:multicopper oxidase
LALSGSALNHGQPPRPGYTPAELDGRVVSAADLRPAESALLPARDVGQEITMDLTGQMSPYEWGFNGVPYAKSTPFEIEPDERVRIRLRNATMMTHPMHLHGHTFALPNGLRKDTVLLTPMQRLDIEFQADNPGDWMDHCHNIYHAEAGMMASLTYRT